MHFSLRIVTYPQYVASLFADNESTRSVAAVVAILIIRKALVSEVGEWAGISVNGWLHDGMCGRDLDAIFFAGLC